MNTAILSTYSKVVPPLPVSGLVLPPLSVPASPEVADLGLSRKRKHPDQQAATGSTSRHPKRQGSNLQNFELTFVAQDLRRRIIDSGPIDKVEDVPSMAATPTVRYSDLGGIESALQVFFDTVAMTHYNRTFANSSNTRLRIQKFMHT